MLISRFILLLLLISSQSYAGWFFNKNKKPVIVYGIEKAVYDSLTDEQQEHIIEVYNGQESERKEYLEKIASLEKHHEHLDELHKEKEAFLTEIKELKLQVETQKQAIANFLTVAEDLLDARESQKYYKERGYREKYFPKIVSIQRGFNATTIKLENDTVIEVSPFEKETTDSWLVGQAVELEKGDGLVYTLDMTNLDAEDSIAVKIKESP
jgi:vacuolar-type H+-ATPase subunit I/STV1